MKMPKPDARDLHAYGGTVLMAAGFGAAFGPAWGLVVAGGVLTYLGIWRMG